MSRLNPQCEAFFQRPRKQVSESETVWYDNQAVGIDTLGGKMKALSKHVNLLRDYTTHSICATFEARHIM